jgi:hypothetical protein
MVGSLLKLELGDIDDYGLGVCEAACTGLQCFKLENLCDVSVEAMRRFFDSCSDTLGKIEFGDENRSEIWDWGLDTLFPLRKPLWRLHTFYAWGLECGWTRHLKALITKATTAVSFPALVSLSLVDPRGYMYRAEDRDADVSIWALVRCSPDACFNNRI